VKRDIFWIMPRRGTLTVLNMLIPFMASLRAMSWGVETMIAPKWIFVIRIMTSSLGSETNCQVRSVA
jgi:hypothetical protein